MNPLDLPFDSDEMLAGLKPWIECESPTYDAAAVNRMMDIAAYDMAILGAHVERIPGRLGFGGSVRARFPHPDMGRVPGILIVGHMDTVHPIGTLELLPFKREGDICYGPRPDGHEGWQLREFGGYPSNAFCGVANAVTGHGALHSG